MKYENFTIHFKSGAIVHRLKIPYDIHSDRLHTIIANKLPVEVEHIKHLIPYELQNFSWYDFKKYTWCLH